LTHPQNPLFVTALSFPLSSIIQGLLTGTALTDKAAVGASARNSLLAVGLSTVPFAIAALTLLVAAAHAQRRRELFCHAAVPLLISAVATALFPVLAGASPVAGARLVVFEGWLGGRRCSRHWRSCLVLKPGTHP
jgi:Na+-driven multidrug efflux pump